jgi:hypothetical protein
MKAPDAFRTISEVAEDSICRSMFFGSGRPGFPQIKPMKRGADAVTTESVTHSSTLLGHPSFALREGFSLRESAATCKGERGSSVASIGQTGSGTKPMQTLGTNRRTWASRPEFHELGGTEDDIFAFLPDAVAPAVDAEIGPRPSRGRQGDLIDRRA